MFIKCVYKSTVWTQEPEKTWKQDEEMEVEDRVGLDLIHTNKFKEVKNSKTKRIEIQKEEDNKSKSNNKK